MRKTMFHYTSHILQVILVVVEIKNFAQVIEGEIQNKVTMK